MQRHPDVVLAAVYAVPDPVVGDQVMAAVQLRPGLDALDADGLAAFLAAQEDLGTKWAPRFVRMTSALPVTATNKVLKRGMRAERWTCADPVLWTPAKGKPYRRLSDAEAAELERAVADRVL
jgi:fatty-acyl-CoA synthase